MRTSLNKATVDAPTAVYSNVAVRLESDDDVTLTASIANRQGIVLAVLTGTWTYANSAWTIVLDDGSGTAVIQQQSGCGCGGSTVEPKMVDANLAAGIYDP